MDSIDQSILNLLSENARTSASEISRRVNLSIPAVSERIKKMEESGLIEQYTVKVNRKQMGYDMLVMIFVSLEHSQYISDFRSTIISYPEVIECHHILGEYDYLLKVLLKDSEELETFLSEKLKSIRGVKHSNTLLLLSALKETINRQEG